MICDKHFLNNQTIYQVFVRQFSSTHDFNGVTKQLDRISALGADILYLIPFYPIGKSNRKGKVGSPYSIYDYTKIDPLNGTVEDFKNLLNEAHKRGLKVIIDMVLNHTSRDAVLLKEHPDWYYLEDGKPSNKVKGWSDVCDLDYSNPALCDEICKILCNWLKMGVDGFRMDVCSLVPAHLWAQAVDALHKINPEVIMLGESIEINFIREMRKLGCEVMSDGEAYNYFDILYVYDIHDTQSAFIEKKGGSLGEWLKDVVNQDGRYKEDYVKCRYLDNHDRPRVARFWKGDMLKMIWALNFYLKGTAFVYAGDETSSEVQNDLFEIDEVQWNFGDKEKDISQYIANLAAIKKHPIYSKGYFDVKLQDSNTAICSYESKDCLSVGIFNFDQEQNIEVPIPDGTYENLITQTPVTVKGGKLIAGNQAIIIETHKRG